MVAKRLGTVPQTFLNAAFVFALVLAALCLLFSALYLYSFLRGTSAGLDPVVQNMQTNQSPGSLEVLINGKLVLARISLLSCGIFVGIAFGFLGFSLCLLGIKESIDVDLQSDTYKAKFARMSPGVLIIVCSSILTGFCATRETQFWYEKTINANVDRKANSSAQGNGATDEGGSAKRNVPDESKEFSNTKP
jgi:hypothetical protein